MPCGGIWPIDPAVVFTAADAPIARWCLHCGGTWADHFCEEWDGYLHGRCIAAYLKTEEGLLVIAHGHAVQRYEETLYEGT